MPRPTAIEAAQTFRRKLAHQESESAERMATAYNRIYQGLSDDISKLADEIAGMELPSRELIIQLARMRAIQAQVKEQLARFTGTVHNELDIVKNRAIEAGLTDALKLLEVSLPALPDDIRNRITGSFARLPVDAIEAAVGLTGKDSPLNTRLDDLFGKYVAEQIENHIVDGIAKGQNPREIDRLLRRNIQNSLGTGLTSILSTIRTAQIKSYQIGNHAQYLANNNVVTGWVWISALDDNRVCLSCIAQHGTVHPLDEVLNDHHAGRCAPVPQTIAYADLGLDIPETITPIETGVDWFARQSQATQREMMGDSMFRAWQDKQFDFADLSRKYDDPVYGELLREASLKDLLGEKAKDYYR